MLQLPCLVVCPYHHVVHYVINIYSNNFASHLFKLTMFTVSLVNILGMAWFNDYWVILKETNATFIRNTVESMVAVSCQEDGYDQGNNSYANLSYISKLNRK